MASRVSVLAVIMSILAVVGCGSSNDDNGGNSASGDAGKSFHVVQLLPLSGPLAAIGAAQKEASQAAVAVVNADGGILGRKVTLDVKDDTGASTQAVGIAQTLASSGSKPDLVIPGATSDEIIPALPIYMQAKLWVVGNASSLDADQPKKYPYYFGTSSNSKHAAVAMTRYLQSKSLTDVALIVPDTEVGKTTLQQMKLATKSAGITLSTQTVDPAALDVTPALSSLQSHKPQVLVVGALSGPVAGLVLKTRTKLGWSVPAVGDPTFSSNDFGTLVSPKDLKGVTLQIPAFSVKGDPAQSTPGFQKFFAALKKINGKTLPFALNTYAVSYGAVALTKAAAEKAKSTDPDKLKAAMESLTPAEAPLWFLSKTLYTAGSHYPDYGAEGSLAFVPAGALDDGSLVPATGS